MSIFHSSFIAEKDYGMWMGSAKGLLFRKWND